MWVMRISERPGISVILSKEFNVNGDLNGPTSIKSAYFESSF
jgi:hypothetical protein